MINILAMNFYFSYSLPSLKDYNIVVILFVEIIVFVWNVIWIHLVIIKELSHCYTYSIIFFSFRLVILIKCTLLLWINKSDVDIPKNKIFIVLKMFLIIFVTVLSNSMEKNFMKNLIITVTIFWKNWTCNQ